jgi:glycosyltransferase involved in cell wall biosynthesis
MQECTFEFEVVIRDDFSDDHTLDIIQRYQRQHPGLIRLIAAEKNIGANRSLLAVLQGARGAFVALCEGDDYWLDKNKLQKQMHVFESRPELTFVSHACRLNRQFVLGDVDFLKGTGITDILMDDILGVSGQFAPTASYMFRRNVVDSLPVWFRDAPVGDFFMEMYGVACGKGAHINEPMSAYRMFSENSWTRQNNEKQFHRMIAYSKKMIWCLEKMREESVFRNRDFSMKMAAYYFNVAIGSLHARDFPAFTSAICACHAAFPGQSATQDSLYRLRRFPRIARALYIIKQRISGIMP